MSDIRLVMVGSVIIFAGFYVASVGSSQYQQMAMQATQFDDCYDYSTGAAVHVSCTQVEHDALLYLALALSLMGGGGYIIFRGIKGRWDQNVKSDEMLGPKSG
ncbi:MAG TPA: hypothetical protein VJR22_00015 [Candidatus Nitrosotalea sp.]|nr:hypothetical protein [Nitrososphaerota archaeon]HKU32215.1 hypothetical protein [Candidatus Nitrosotalea sp.]